MALGKMIDELAAIVITLLNLEFKKKLYTFLSAPLDP